ncbi:MAG: hypothetical protein V4597_11555 [Pseudomonadota bacterium]
MTPFRTAADRASLAVDRAIAHLWRELLATLLAASPAAVHNGAVRVLRRVGPAIAREMTDQLAALYYHGHQTAASALPVSVGEAVTPRLPLLAAGDTTEALHAWLASLLGMPPPAAFGRLAVSPLPTGGHRANSGSGVLTLHQDDLAAYNRAARKDTAAWTKTEADAVHVVVHETLHDYTRPGLGDPRAPASSAAEAVTETLARAALRGAGYRKPFRVGKMYEHAALALAEVARASGTSPEALAATLAPLDAGGMRAHLETLLGKPGAGLAALDLIHRPAGRSRAELRKASVALAVRPPVRKPPSAPPAVLSISTLVLPPPPEPVVRAWLAQFVRPADWQTLGTPTDRRMPEELANVLASGKARGLGQRELALEVRPHLDGSRVRARRAARTFGIHAAHSGQLDAWESLGDLVIGYTLHSAKVPLSRPWHVARDGREYYRHPGPGQDGLEKCPHPPLEPADPAERPAGTSHIAFNCLCYVTPILREP